MKWRAIGGNYNGWEFETPLQWPMGCWTNTYRVRDRFGCYEYLATFADWLRAEKIGVLCAYVQPDQPDQ